MGEPAHNDVELERIRDRFTGRRLLNDCLMQIPKINARKVRRFVEMKSKNGLDEIITKASDGLYYVMVDDFIKWVDRGMKK